VGKKLTVILSVLYYLPVLWMSFFLSTIDARCQDIQPTITLDGSFYPSRNLKDANGSYGHSLAYARLTLPVLKNVKLKDNGLRFYLLSLSANASIDNTQLSLLPANRTFYTGTISINGIYKASGKSSWFSKFTTSSFEDDVTIRSPSLRVSGFALYRRSVRETFFYMVGGAYSFVYGSGLPLPVLGVGWRFTNNASLTAILPFSLTYRFGKTYNQFSIFIKPNGGVSNFYNNVFFMNEGEKIVFRRREFVLGVRKRIRLSDQWSILAETGLVAARRIFFSKDFTRENDAVISEVNVKAGPYVSLGLKFKFKKDKPSDVQIDPIDVDSILPNY